MQSTLCKCTCVLALQSFLDLVKNKRCFLGRLDHEVSNTHCPCRTQGDFLEGRAEPNAVKSNGQAQAQPQPAEANKGQVNIFSGESSAGNHPSDCSSRVY